MLSTLQGRPRNGETVSPFTEDAPTKQGRPQKNGDTVSPFTEDAAAKTGAGPGIAANLGLYGLTWGFRAVALVLTPPRNLTDAKTDCYQIRLHHHGNPWANCETCS